MPSLDSAKAIIGPAFLSIDGTDVGFTTDDGLTLKTEFSSKEFEAAQSMVIPRVHRFRVRAVLSGTFLQLDYDNMALLYDFATADSAGTQLASWNKGTARELVLTAPGPDGKTRIYTMTGTLITPPETAFQNSEYTGAAVEFLILGDPSAESYWSMFESAGSAAAPTVASYSTVTSEDSASSMVDGATSIPVTNSFVVNLSESIRPDFVNSTHFYLIATTGNVIVPATVAYYAPSGVVDYTKVQVTPTSSLATSTAYKLVAAAGVRSFDGIAMTALAAVDFTTAS